MGTPYEQEQLSRQHQQDLLQAAARRRTLAALARPSLGQRVAAPVTQRATLRRQPRATARLA
ncbi:MAG: hypothetical protein M3Q65_11170 [Chloroflexota bacterium]|nr:hypothetical protein [Chloroflexota bacterium]